MIIKTFEISKKKFDKQNFFLIYGENEGLKKEVIQGLLKYQNGNTENYDETQILINKELFYEKIFNQSLFEKEKVIVVNRCSEKIYEIIENILEKDISDTKIFKDAVNALESLGYKKVHAINACKKLQKNDELNGELESVIKKALKLLMS